MFVMLLLYLGDPYFSCHFVVTNAFVEVGGPDCDFF